MHFIHQKIGTPKMSIKNIGENKAEMTVSPLPPGYGVTIGNSFRRVSLSSLPGTRAVAMKMEGSSHEYTTIPGVKESVFDIGMNLRLVHFESDITEVLEVSVPLVKTGTITAGDIKVPSNIKIMNPEQVILTCTKADNKKKMFIRLEKNVGYRLVDNEMSKKEPDLEYILIDANFSPIVSIKYEVNPTRVGDITNLDELKIEVETDGSISPENAIKLSARIIEEYNHLFNREDAYYDENFTSNFDEIKRKREIQKEEKESSAEKNFEPIDVLGLSQRTLNALVNGNITSVEKLLSYSLSQLSQLRGFGQKAKVELEEVLVAKGRVKSVDELKFNNKN